MMEDDIMKKFCPNCSQLYLLQCVSSKLTGNLPLFLPCGHSMCENCITNIIKCLEPIECKVCFCDVNVTATEANELIQNKLKLHQKFPVNLHLAGELTLCLMKASEASKKKTEEEDHFLDLKALIQDDMVEANCYECHTATSKMCNICATSLCDTCFNKIHKNFVVFKTHILQPIETALPQNNCTMHSGKPLDYYCKECKKAICMDCMMVGGEKSCKHHDVVSLQEVNLSFMDDLSEIFPKVDEMFRRLTKTALDIGYLLHNYETDTGSAKEITHTIASIDQHFSKLCSIVQKHKEEIINIIMYLKLSKKESLQKAKTEIANSIKKAKHILNIISKASNKDIIKQINLPALLEEAKKIIDTPWYLNKNEESKESLKVTVNEDLCSLINDYVHLEGNVKSVYKLYSMSELCDEVDIPAAPTTVVYPPELPKDVRHSIKQKVEKDDQKGKALYTNAPKYRSKSGSVSSLNSNSSENSYKKYITQNNNYQQPIVQPVSPFAESQHPQQLRDGSQELVYITHIVDPHNFFVQRTCFQGLIKDMLREFRNAVSFAKPSVNHIMPGKTYLAFNKVDNMWQRCRVISVDMKENSNPRVQVFCFDFGSIEIVSVENLRLLPPSKIQCPFPLAINCSLANCVPKSGTWSSEDSFLIQNIIDNKQAVIYIRRVIPIANVDFKLECDVTTFEHGVSIAHALVFHERAKMPHPKLPYPSTLNVTEKPKLYMSHNDFKCDSTEVITITHVVSPDKFFVRKNHLEAVHEKLVEDLEQEYSLASTVGTVYLPEIGMVCALGVEQYNSRGPAGTWARGVVTELPGRGRVRVLLPDSGHSLLVHWAVLRYIRNKFLTLRALAAECHLAGITPCSKKWSVASVDLLQKYEGKFLELQVENNHNKPNRSCGSIGVTLYDKEDNDNIICLNNEMIKHKFAVSFGVNMFNKSPVEEQVVTNKPLHKEQAAQKPKTGKITILKKQMPKTINKNDLQAKDKGPLRLEVKILQYQSPSHIYVSLVHQQKSFNELFEKIQKYYSKCRNDPKEDWKVGYRCCTLCNQSQTWRRAVVMELENETAKLFYSDFACIETVPKSSLRELTSEFTSCGDAAIKCHLCGIMPAVGEDWPSLTKEYLKELLDAYQRVFITKLGNFKDKSMPIEIWVYHTKQGSALEPNKSEWRCLNKKIIEQGLGVPDKSLKVASTNIEDAGDTLSFLNITGSVNEWLQLEPLPMVPVKKVIKETSHVESNTNSPLSNLEDEDNNSQNNQDPESSNVMYITDWLPAEPLPCKEFTGLPTYIDNEGVIYLHDVSQQDTLDLIRKALDVRFKDPDPKAKFSKWTIGEPCVALFFLDNRYYRGRVVEVNKENSTCLIHYIDYGNEEICSFSNLRKSVPLHQIPAQAHKCVLNRIRPIGKQWDRQTLDYIHKSVVEKQCYVKVSGEAINGVMPVELKFDKLWINDHLVDFEMAAYSDGTKALIRMFAPTDRTKKVKEHDIVIESDSGPDYIVVDESDTTIEQLSSSRDSFENSIKGADWSKMVEEELTSLDGNYISYPKDIPEEFMCNITVINDVNILELNVIFDDDTTRVYEQMFDEVQAESVNLPPLNGMFENKACVAVFPEDGRWYRASILQFSEAKNRVKVRYVDYGNIEVVSLADTREIKKEWANLPPATVSAKLFGLRLNPEADIGVVTKEYKQIFLEHGQFHVKVISYDDDSVPLVELRNDKEDLVYKRLVEDNMLI